MTHVAHPSADALLSACSRSDWPQATRHWRSLPPFARDLMAMDALLCSCEAIRASDAWPMRSEADSALRPLCASLVDSPGRVGMLPEMARALSHDFCRLGLFQCLVEIDRNETSRHSGTGLDDCLSSWMHVHFRSDARSYLVRLSLADLRSGMEALRVLARWAGPDDSSALERAALVCTRASTHFWPDERDALARDAGVLLAKTRQSLAMGSAAESDTPLAPDELGSQDVAQQRSAGALAT